MTSTIRTTPPTTTTTTMTLLAEEPKRSYTSPRCRSTGHLRVITGIPYCPNQTETQVSSFQRVLQIRSRESTRAPRGPLRATVPFVLPPFSIVPLLLLLSPSPLLLHPAFLIPLPLFIFPPAPLLDSFLIPAAIRGLASPFSFPPLSSLPCLALPLCRGPGGTDFPSLRYPNSTFPGLSGWSDFLNSVAVHCFALHLYCLLMLRNVFLYIVLICLDCHCIASPCSCFANCSLTCFTLLCVTMDCRYVRLT